MSHDVPADPPGCVRVTHRSGWAALVDPRRGATVRSFRSPDGWELFAQGPAAASEPEPGDPFLASGLTGHVDCLPTIDPVPEGLDGRPDLSPAPLVDHGPLWALPWSVRGPAAPSRFEGRLESQVECRVEVPGWGLRVTRTVVVDEGRLRLGYTMANPRPDPVPVLWAGHGLLVAPPGSRVRAAGWRPDPASATTKRSGLDVATGDTLLAAVGGPAGLAVDAVGAGRWVKAYAPWPADGAWLERSDAAVHVAADVPGARLWLGLWLNDDGMPPGRPVRHVALEPTTGDADRLSDCVDRGSCWWVGPRTTVSWSMTYTVHSGATASPGR